MAWGTHFCHFFDGHQDLPATLVPYFKAGLDHGEACLWVTREPFDTRAAREALTAVVPDLATREQRGQIEILDYAELHRRDSGGSGNDAMLDLWVRRQHEALARGYAGLRITGNCVFVEEEESDRALEHHAAHLSEAFRDQHVLALCSYCMGHCSARGVLDVVRNHQFALARRGGDWQVVESAAMKVAKEELRQMSETLEARVAERMARLETALRVRDDFLSVASHELRTPLSSLKLYLAGISRAIMRRGLSDEEIRSRVRKAETQCERLEALLSNLLELTRARSGKLTVVREPFDLAALARQTVERFSDEMHRHGRALRMHAPAPVEGEWDRLRIEQVLTNLITNAIKYAPGSPIEVMVGVDGGEAVMAVRDYGQGIAAADHARIFERFEQARPGRTGFGLGLWIVKRIVEAHGGTITVESEVDAGAAFIVRLPWRAYARA